MTPPGEVTLRFGSNEVKKNYMFTPGPTMVPAEVLLAEAAPMIHHRTPQFSQILQETVGGLKELFGTEQEVLMISGSGTAAMEAAVCNTCSPGDGLIAVSGGKFGERWGDIGEAFGCNVKTVEVPWGQSFTAAQARAAISQMPDARALCITHSETSTGALTDVEAIAAVTRACDTLLLVDSITGVGVHPVRMDQWGADVIVSGSQKGCMIPPGLAFIAVSPRAWEAVDKCTSPRFYLDLKAMRSEWEEHTTTPFTPPVSLIRALHRAIGMMREEGYENVFARHARLAQATRAAMMALGLKLVAENPANGVTAVWAPEGIDTGEMTKKMRDEYGITIAGGQGGLKGKAFRVGHMGYVSEADLLVAVAGVERALAEMGYACELGTGVAVAEKVLFAH